MEMLGGQLTLQGWGSGRRLAPETQIWEKSVCRRFISYGLGGERESS